MPEQPLIREASIEVDGIRIHYLQAGSGPPLVMVHALVGSARNWLPNIAALARVRTVYALDLVNMGETQRVPGIDPRMASTADRLARFMDSLEISSAEIVGASHGGAIAMMLAARHPHRVRSLILFAPANPFCQLSSWLIDFYGTWYGSVFARAIPLMPGFVHQVAHRRVYGDPRKANKEEMKGYTEGLTESSVTHILGIIRAWWLDMDILRGLLPVIAASPTLLLWGDRDRVVGLASGYQLKQAISAQLVVVPGAGHLAFAESPHLCNQTMLEWLTNHPLTAECPAQTGP